MIKPQNVILRQVKRTGNYVYRISEGIKLKLSDGDFLPVFQNISWLFFDKVLRLGVGLVLGILVARYLGAAKFGKFNYSIALTTLLGTFCTLGLEGIIVKDLLQAPEKRAEILGTTFLMRFLGGLFSIAASYLVVSVTDFEDKELIACVLILSLGLIFQPFDVIESFFQSRIKSKFVVISKNTAFLLCAMLKAFALWFKGGLLVFVGIATLEVSLGAVGLVYFYHQQTLESIKQWRNNIAFFKEKLRECWPLVLSGLVIIIYMRIDQIMIKQMMGEREVGVYSAAVRIAEVWYFVYTIISNSIYPALIASKNNTTNYLSKIQKLLDYNVVIALCVGVCFAIGSDWIILFLYGAEFSEAADVLRINIWCGVFVALGVASSQYLILEGLNKVSFYRTLSGAVINLLLNFIMIPRFGIKGAAISTLIAQFTAAYMFDIFNNKTRKMFFMKTKALFLISPLSRI